LLAKQNGVWGVISDKEKRVSNKVLVKAKWRVIRYKGSKDIKEMIENEQFIDAFVHAQLGIEKILWDKIVGIFENQPENAREGEKENR
jgi:hypothetical protein